MKSSHENFRHEQVYLRRQQPHLGTFVEIGISSNFVRGNEVIADAFDQIRQIHELLSFQSSTSELNQMNHSSGKFFKFHPYTVLGLRLGRAMTRISGGLFTCFCNGIGQWEELQLKGQSARLACRSKVNLDGLAKGMAVDLGVRSLRRNGVQSGWINAGGDLRVFGQIELPIVRRGVSGEFRGFLKNGAVATSEVRSESSDRFLGKLHQSQGSQPQIGTWTVMAREAWRADALTKVAALAKPKVRSQLIRKLGGELLTGQPS